MQNREKLSKSSVLVKSDDVNGQDVPKLDMKSDQKSDSDSPKLAKIFKIRPNITTPKQKKIRGGHMTKPRSDKKIKLGSEKKLLSVRDMILKIENEKKCQGGSTGKIVSFTDVDKKPKLTVYGTCSNSEKIESGDSDRSKKVPLVPLIQYQMIGARKLPN